jgi:hypothetical protein
MLLNFVNRHQIFLLFFILKYYLSNLRMAELFFRIINRFKLLINLHAISDLTKKTPTIDVKNSEAEVAKAIKVAPATSYYERLCVYLIIFKDIPVLN